ncbi:hypothetical protein GIY30_07770 [Gordonia sp. HNM0687]|uniref:SRPBCC family protein n=1 Tax=Gordonia mangrovi TaxID=2665643 RepID=A0A6L7GMV9_9ACTN|nr:hypothetical protein [Gordonia mangrovi]MXP21250.1 hypothetical protein [Gordonia mangrovi]UVF78223.1 hypothetical protein NWF22_23920 [Gordonia mangrovi]
MAHPSDRFHTHTQRTVVAAPVDLVLERVTSMDGINDELMPYLKMRLPRHHRGKTIADMEIGQPLGKVPLLFGGFLPLDYDDLTLAELTPGRGFREASSMASMTVWRHARTLTALSPTSTEVVDELDFRPRLPLRPLAPLLALFVANLFRHRHRKLLAHFAD